jgi:hypothetical protein
MRILSQVQADLVDSDASLADTLRKARVLAHRINSSELDHWASLELDGYKDISEVPDYRIIEAGCAGTWTNGRWRIQNQGVPLHQIDSQNLVDLITKYPVRDGIRTVEHLSASKEQNIIITPELTTMVNHYVGDQGYGFSEIRILIHSYHFEQILDTVKNRLLDFVLRLNDEWQPDDKPPSNEFINHLVSITIYNNPQGGNVSIFDQRDQQVDYQYNAAGDINFNSVHNVSEFIDQLDKLKREIELASNREVIKPDIAAEAESHLAEATQEAKSARPNKDFILQHLGQAKTLLEDVTAATGLVTAFLRAMGVARGLLG